MSHRRWLIQNKELTSSERQNLWNTIHSRGYREDEVWSVTKDAGFRERFVSKLGAISDARRILLPGCGSETFLQRTLLDRLPQLEGIVCSDFEPAILIAEASQLDPKVSFHVADSTRVHERWPQSFDVQADASSREGMKQWHGIDDPRICRWDFMVKVQKKAGG